MDHLFLVGWPWSISPNHIFTISLEPGISQYIVAFEKFAKLSIPIKGLFNFEEFYAPFGILGQEQEICGK